MAEDDVRVPGRGAALRFAVVGGGLRSAEWRIWTGSNKPTNDLYLSPRRQGGSLKVSIHKDGYCQHGFTASYRDRLHHADRRALDRWRIATAGPWCLAYVLEFPTDELQELVDLDSRVLRVAAAQPGHSTILIVLISDGSVDLPVNLSGAVVGRLNRRDGEVVVLRITAPFDTAVLDDLGLGRPVRHVWELPEELRTEGDHAYFFGRDDDAQTRFVIEYDASRHPRVLDLALPGFDGEVRDWPALMPQPRAFHACAVLRCHPDEPPILFLDRSSRCNWSALGAYASHLLASYNAGRADSEWDRFPDGSLRATITTAQEGHRAGVQPSARLYLDEDRAQQISKVHGKIVRSDEVTTFSE